MVVLPEQDPGLECDHGGAAERFPSATLELVNPFEVQEWNSLCAAHPGGSFFHSIEWLRVLGQTYGFKAAGLLSRRDGEPCALVPFMEVRSWPSGSRGVSLPFTDLCAPLLWAPAPSAGLWPGIVACARRAGWGTVEVRGDVGLAQSMPSVSFFGHELDLTPGVEKLHGAFDDAIRRGIRKAQREELKTEISGELAAVKRYYQLHCQTRKRHGMPPQPFRFFANLHEHVLKTGLGCIITAFHRGLPIAAALFVQFGRRAIFKFGASNQRYQHLRGNNLVMWEAVQWFARQGFTTLSFGRTSKANAGLRRFKLGWAAREEEIRYFKYDLRADAFMREQDRAAGWHNRVFRVMPMTFARIIGSVLYRRFA